MTTYTLNRLPYKEGRSAIELEEIGRYKSANKAYGIAEALEEMYELDLFIVIEEQEIEII